MTSKKQTQIHMEDTIIEDSELEQMLEERQELKQSVAAYRKLDKDAKNKIRSIETPTPYRIGRFIISRRDLAAKTVEFETQASFSFGIKLAGED